MDVPLLREKPLVDEVQIFQEKLTTTKFSLLSDVHKRLQKPDHLLLEETEKESNDKNVFSLSYLL